MRITTQKQNLPGSSHFRLASLHHAHEVRRRLDDGARRRLAAALEELEVRDERVGGVARADEARPGVRRGRGLGAPPERAAEVRELGRGDPPLQERKGVYLLEKCL